MLIAITAVRGAITDPMLVGQVIRMHPEATVALTVRVWGNGIPSGDRGTGNTGRGHGGHTGHGRRDDTPHTGKTGGRGRHGGHGAQDLSPKDA